MTNLKHTLTIVGLGDSITAAKEMSDPENRWLRVLEQDLAIEFPNIDFSVINSGVGGNSDREKMARFTTDVLSHAPGYLLLQFGGNNSGFVNPAKHVELEESRAFLEEVSMNLPATTKIMVITFPRILDDLHQTMQKPGAMEHFSAFGGLDGFVEQYRVVTRKFARDHGYPLVDLSAAMRHGASPDIYTINDGVHLSVAGNRLLAELVFECLKHHIKGDKN
jgi:lysophospholipase L1-like esterase